MNRNPFKADAHEPQHDDGKENGTRSRKSERIEMRPRSLVSLVFYAGIFVIKKAEFVNANVPCLIRGLVQARRALGDEEIRVWRGRKRSISPVYNPLND
jgi:hypothetical protein